MNLNNKIEFTCSRDKRYFVYVIEDLFNSNDGYLLNTLKNYNYLVITTPTVMKLYGESLTDYLRSHDLQPNIEVIEISEQSKTLDIVSKICKLAKNYNLDRQGTLVAFGGGICSDVVCMAASILRRGIKHIRIPTTLVGQIDAGIGIKGGVNFCNQKNYLGCFFPPSSVYIDVNFLSTLNDEYIHQGLAEIIKIAIVRDSQLFDLLKKNYPALIRRKFQQPLNISIEIISRSIQLMLNELNENPYENKASERLVDFGHTFSPQLEATSNFKISHGEAVAIDMAYSSILSHQLGYCSKNITEEIIFLLQQMKLPIYSQYLDMNLCRQSMKEMALHRKGSLNLVIPTDIGAATFIRTPESLTESVLEKSLGTLASFCDNNTSVISVSRSG